MKDDSFRRGCEDSTRLSETDCRLMTWLVPLFFLFFLKKIKTKQTHVYLQ